MKIGCPHCQAVNESPKSVNGMMQCQHCGQWFAEPLAAKDLEELAKSRVKIWRTADRFIGLAGFLFGIGFLILFGSIAMVIEGNGATGGIITGGALISLALWFYLIGQIVHIRGNTEK